MENGDNESDWADDYFPRNQPSIIQMQANLPIVGCMGNHEGSGVLFQKYWPYPFEQNRYWSFDYGPAHVAIIDQYVKYDPGSAQLTWLDQDLSSTDIVIVQISPETEMLIYTTFWNFPIHGLIKYNKGLRGQDSQLAE